MGLIQVGFYYRAYAIRPVGVSVKRDGKNMNAWFISHHRHVCFLKFFFAAVSRARPLRGLYDSRPQC